MLFSITGPSGVGKGHLKQQILDAFPRLAELVWVTTRPLRADEVIGQSNRRNISLKDLFALRQQEKLAYEQHLFGHWYALTFEELEKARVSDCITEAHIDTLSVMKILVPNVISVALLPQGIEFLRTHLLIHRGAQWDADTEERLAAAQREIDFIREKSSDFSLVVDVSKENEAVIHKTIIRFLNQYLNVHGGER